MSTTLRIFAPRHSFLLPQSDYIDLAPQSLLKRLLYPKFDSEVSSHLQSTPSDHPLSPGPSPSSLLPLPYLDRQNLLVFRGTDYEPVRRGINRGFPLLCTHRFTESRNLSLPHSGPFPLFLNPGPHRCPGGGRRSSRTWTLPGEEREWDRQGDGVSGTHSSKPSSCSETSGSTYSRTLSP